jgi:galactofuranose transport system permease protein
MTTRMSATLSNNQRFLPLTVTILLLLAAYMYGAVSYPGMRETQVFFNLFRNSPYLLISAVGMTFVILSGGIDLSVGGVIALTTVASAALLREEWNPWAVISLMLGMGMALGTIMGYFITYLKVQPFIATLAGMWFARGMCFFISDDAISIDNRVYTILARTKLLIPGLANPVTKEGPYISILVVVALLIFFVGIRIAHFSRFGRTVYAMGGNEHSARLMGLPVNRTKMAVYILNGFCSALAGITLSMTVMSGHGLYAPGFEMTAIAAVVIGGTMLTGGEGYVFGTMFGVLITMVIQTLIQFNGKLSSWWTSIAVAALTLIFIGVQSLFAARKLTQLSGKRTRRSVAMGGPRLPRWLGGAPLRSRQGMLLGGLAVIILIAVIGLTMSRNARNASAGAATSQEIADCEHQPFRREEAATLALGGTALVYERNGGPTCVNELHAIYPDGRVVSDNGSKIIETEISTEEVDQLLSDIASEGWFTDDMYDTWHTLCRQCYGYYVTVAHDGQEKTVRAVDGGTDAPAAYWQVVSQIQSVLPEFE